MANRRAVNVATITEEDIIEEEIGENGMVETVASTLDRNSREEKGCPSPDICANEAEGSGSSRASLERPSSLVENDEAAPANDSILSCITFEGGDSCGSPQRRSRISRETSSDPRSSSSSSRRSSSSPSSASPVRKPFTRRGSRASGFTMILSDRFVTELTLYDPSNGATQGSSVCLGVFIATDQVTGDHSVYKVSPVSPLAVMKVKPHDRILKLNSISITGWSHNCVLEFVRNLPLTSLSSQVTPDTSVEFGLCLEYRRSGKNVRSSAEAPVNKRVTSRVKIRKRRVTVASVHEEEARLQYRETILRKFRLREDPSLCLAASMDAPSTISSLVVAEEDACPGSSASFRLHLFDRLPSTPEGEEQVCVIEGEANGCHLHAVSHTGIAFMHGVTSDVMSFTQVDVRCFSVRNVAGSKYSRIKSIDTDRFISASRNGIQLVAQNDDSELPKSTLFEVVP